MQIREVGIAKILNPTAIDLGEYVINPYKGCEYACLYCYVRHNKVTKRETRPWGTYVDVRCNAPAQLEKELFIKKPQRVLLGSTTECCQPLEKDYKITKKIIEILNKNKVYYSILTRSPLWIEYLPLLKEGFCECIYFTVNSFCDKLKDILEPKSASFSERAAAVNKLLAEKVPVIPYVSPILPGITDIEKLFQIIKRSDRIEFEGLKISVGNIDQVIAAITLVYPQLELEYRQMARNRAVYEDCWQKIKKDIIRQAIKYRKNQHIYIHRFSSYFENKYRNE